jgi:glycerol dehydratase small subunit
VLAGRVGPQDVRISQQTLEYQAQIAEQMQRHAVARNFRRAAELIAIPDARILEIYNALRRFVLRSPSCRPLPMNWNTPGMPR